MSDASKTADGFGRLAAIAVLLTSALLCVTLGAGYLPNDNDALYADVARTIVATGDWLNLDIHGVPFLDKPPGFFWVAALFIAVLGSEEFVLRLPAALAGGLTAGVLVLGSRVRGAGRTAALLAPLFLLASPLWIEYCRRAYMEVPTALCVIGAVLAYQHGLTGLDGKGARPWGLLLGGVLTGVGFMAKSLVGLFGVIPVLGLIVLKRRWDVLTSKWFWGGSLSAALIVGPWHIQQLLTNRDAFLQFTWKLHVEDQIFEAQPWSTGPWWFYLDALVSDAPAIGLMIAIGLGLLVVALVRREDVEELDLHLALTLGALAAVFTASETKKVLYLIPFIPPAALLASRMLARFLGERPLWTGLAAAGALVMFLPSLHLFQPSQPFLRGAEPLAVAAEATADRLPADAPLYSLDVYFSPIQYYGRRPGISFWTKDKLPNQTSRIPYIRYGDNVRYLAPPKLLTTMGDELPGLWFVPGGLVQAAGLTQHWTPIYDADGIVVFDTRK